MKNLLIVSSVLLIMGFGFFILKSKLSHSTQIAEVKFQNRARILPTDTVIKITENGFEPPMVNIKSGTRVVWINESANYSWPASNPHPDHTDYPEFDPGEPFKNGEIWALVFERPGNWKYHDHINPGHRGVILVSPVKK